jgi:hypothetical protein
MWPVITKLFICIAVYFVLTKNKYQLYVKVVISSQNVFPIHLASLDIPEDTYENGNPRQ